VDGKFVASPWSSLVVPRQTEASQNLFELVKGRNLIVYADADIRLAISRAVAIETSRGWRIAKEKQSHKIDVVIALAKPVKVPEPGMLLPVLPSSSRWPTWANVVSTHLPTTDGNDCATLCPWPMTARRQL
jgi:hypothetical protein